MGLARGQPLIPQVNRQSRQCAEFGGKSLGLGGLRAHIARQVHRVAHHDARHRKPPRQPSQGAQVLPPVVTPLQGQHGLRRQAQLVRHSHPNAPVTDVEAEITRLRGRFQSATPAYKLNAQLRRVRSSHRNALEPPAGAALGRAMSSFLMNNGQMDRLNLPSALEVSHRVLIAGAGGGFDVYAGLPIYERLRSSGKNVFLANLSFAELRSTSAVELYPSLYEVNANTQGEEEYFPERSLARFLSQRYGTATSVYAFDNTGGRPLRLAYAHLASLLAVDAIVLTDGGTDILLRGDEANLGTPAEDAISLAAVSSLDVPTRILACLGLGVDTFHGVCHAHWLENVADLTAEGAFLGAAALVRSMPEVGLYLDAVFHSELETRSRTSVVNASIASAIEGHFGDFHRSRRTHASKLFISPLMTLLWAFDLVAVARQNLYLDLLRETETNRDVLLAIEGFHAGVRCRLPEQIPY